MLESDTIKKKWVNKTFQQELKESNSKKYEVETIWDSEIYVKNSKGYQPDLYYLIFSKGYLEEKNI